MRIMAIRVDIVLLLACLLIQTMPTEVDNLNILLPELKQSQSSLPVQLITAQAGCYEWNSSYPQFLQVNPHQPTNNGCSRQAVISVAKLGSYSSTIYISAIDGASQATLNIPVRIRKLNKITIASKSRMMNIRQMQKLQLFGYDVDSNTFTSLEGLRFKWELIQDSQIIETVLIQNAHLYLPLRTRENIEKRGQKSDMLVVRAISPGNLKVQVKCVQTGYQSLTDEITISVHERFELKPGPIINMATDTSFLLKLVRPNQQQIQLPQSYYRIISCNDFIINQTLYLKVPNYPSKCTIKVQDTRTKPAYQSRVQIIVSQANQLRIITDPLIIVGRQSRYQVQLYKDGSPLFGQSNKLVYSSDFNLNKYAKTLIAERKGSGYLSAELGSLKKSVVINALLPVTILLPQKYLHLPVGEYFKLRVLGGTGVYDYQISNDIVSVNTMAVLHGRQIGQTKITIKDRSHPLNQIVLEVKISEISKIYSLQENKQTDRDQWAYFYVLAQNIGSETFTQCLSAQFSLSVPTANLDVDSKVNFVQSISFLHFHRSEFVKAAITPTSLLKGKQYEIIDKYSQYVKQNEINSQDLKSYILSLQNYGICRAIKFRSIVSFEQKALISLEGQTDVKTIVPLRVYDLIQNTIQDDQSVFLMTPESTLNWTYTGGSYRWLTSSTRASVNDQILKEGIYPILKCPNKQTTSEVYRLKVFNQQSKSLLFPASQTTSISLVCKFPKKLHLALQHGQIFDELYIQKQTEVKGLVKATDQLSQQFFNSSNVIYQFTTTNGDVSYSAKRFQYKSKGLNDTLYIFTNKLDNGLTYNKVLIEIDIYLVDPLVISHPMSTDKKHMTILTLFTPKKPYVLYAKQIYPQLQIQCSDAVACEKGQNYIAVKLLRIGKGIVHIKDKKIYGSEDWHFQFIIVQPDEVGITGNKDYLQQGDTLQLSVSNYHNQQLISPFTYEPSYLGVVLPGNLKLLQQNIQKFKVRAEKAGQYQVQGESTYPRIRRTKQPWNITVYKKISINIEDVTSSQTDHLHILQANTAVVIGCRRFLRIEGGPHQITSKVVQSSSGVTLNQLNQRNFQLSSKKQGLYSFTLEVYYKNNKISVIYAQVNVNKIQRIQLHTIEQPVVGTHFRIHPKFKIGDSNLQEMYCDYFYQWKVSQGLVKIGQSLSFGLLDATSINATAIKSGNQIITLEVKQKNGDLLIRQNKYLQILEDFILNLPTYIKSTKCQTIPTSIIIAPNTRHVFDRQIKIKSDEGIVYVAQQHNILQSGKKLGHSTIRLNQVGYRSMLVEVEVKQIMGLFIQNQEGFISIEPNRELEVQIYLQDNNGRLFYTPLQNLDIFVSSSNSDLVQASLTAQKNFILLKSHKQGVCIIYVKIPSRNIFDAIAVSVGIAISPGRQIKITKNGIIKFNASSSQAHWSSENKQIVRIDSNTGVASALKTGKTKVHYGQLSSIVSVLPIAKVQQVGQQKYKGLTMQVQYQLFWLVDNQLFQISNIKSEEAINNNLDLSCVVTKNLGGRAHIINKQGHQRLICQINLQKHQKWPESFTVKIKDANGLVETEWFQYKFTPIFNVEKQHIVLSPHNTQTQIVINSPSPLTITMKYGKPRWIVSSDYDQSRKQQKIKVDMTGEQTNSSCNLEVSLQGQQTQIKIDFKMQGEQKGHNFWSYNLDWPDYLILFMALIFFVICYMQYSSEQKIKNT